MKASKNTYIVAGFILLSFAIAGGALLIRDNTPYSAPTPINQIPLDSVFADAASNANFVQVSFFGIENFNAGIAVGKGHVRYSDGKQIFGYSGGKNGAVVAAMFEDTTSNAYKACAEILMQPVPFRYEIFIAGEGTSQTAPPSAMSGAARVQFKKITECGLIASVRR